MQDSEELELFGGGEVHVEFVTEKESFIVTFSATHRVFTLLILGTEDDEYATFVIQ